MDREPIRNKRSAFDRAFIKVAAAVLTPAKLISNGATQLKENIKENIEEKVEEKQKQVKAVAIMGAAGFMFAIFFFVTLGLFLNEVLNSTYGGFAIVTGIFLVAFLVVLYLKKEDKL